VVLVLCTVLRVDCLGFELLVVCVVELVLDTVVAVEGLDFLLCVGFGRVL
jgi:hypothetical protein